MLDEAGFIARLAVVFREELDQPDLEINMQTVQQDIGQWDSLAHVRLVVGVERAFGVQFEVAEIENMGSVRGFYEATRRHMK
jgi:acyl carrier protein